ncbi:HAD family hydrolase [Streptococcus orisasini]|uniref:HAD family hydrolase n=1 Tax=Streptococcus orisasini TaxID=1080071 RepID=UPI000709701E|nr:HAD family hydrolase [Streptococcus orisasini]
MYQTILFDLDGTLTDSGQGILNSIRYALTQLDRPIPDDHLLKTFIGPPLKTSFEQTLGMSLAESQAAIALYRDYFREKGIFENQIYPGIPELLADLKSQKRQLLVATSKPEVFAQQILEHFELSHFFEIITGASMDSSRSKKSDIIAYALKNADTVNPAETIMVGDRKYDILGAKENQLASLGVLYGYGSFEELQAAKADYIAKSTEDLRKILLR